RWQPEPAVATADHRWIETVIGDLEGRSPATRAALAKALLEHSVTSVGHVSGLKLEARESAEKEHSTCDQSTDPSTPHVSGTTSSRITMSASRRKQHDAASQTGKNPHKTAESEGQSTFPVSGTTFPEIAGNPRSSQRSEPMCGTKVRHTVLPNVGLTSSNDERIQGRKCITLVGAERSFAPLQILR
ncbi:MAG: hypothetical protein ACOY7T_02955, partial [Pseudomonadota bacterium]